MVIVDLLAATICFLGNCFPVLTGAATPAGEYSLSQYEVDDPKYQGTVLAFKHSADGVFAIHRVLDVEHQNRQARLLMSSSFRRDVTDGCINVTDQVYEQLVNCCKNSTILVR